jgi:hypothetical protein
MNSGAANDKSRRAWPTIHPQTVKLAKSLNSCGLAGIGHNQKTKLKIQQIPEAEKAELIEAYIHVDLLS